MKKTPVIILFLFVAFSCNKQNTEASHTEAANTEVFTDTIQTLPSPMLPMDTMMWKNSGFIPEDVQEELKELKKINFSQLKQAKIKPSDKEAEDALTDRYSAELLGKINNQKIHIKVGKCFEAALQQSIPEYNETSRVTCMVATYNSNNEVIESAQPPLVTAYDFVRYDHPEHPDYWYALDISQTIPFDYELNQR